jgi:hypothetical protein
MGRVITASIAVLMIVGQTAGGLSSASAQSADRGATPAADAVADGVSGKRTFVPRRDGVPVTCLPSPDAPARKQLDPGLRYLGPCDRPADAG